MSESLNTDAHGDKIIGLLPFVDRIDDSDVDAGFLDKLPLAFVKKNMVFPLRESEGRLNVAIAGPEAIFALDEISTVFSKDINPVIVPAQQILDVINRFYGRLSGSAEEAVSELHGESIETIAHQWDEPKDLLDLTDEAPIIRLLNALIFQAVKEKASDIHIEPYERAIDVRFRRDGILYLVLTPPKIVHEALVSRVKIMGGMDIAEKRLPQDGRIRLLVAGVDIDVRVSVVPTTFGERVVLRLLDRKGAGVSLDGIGLSASQSSVVDNLLSRSNGIILVTGPTGSGKTTSLYAAMNRIDKSRRNVITIEDPVEYRLTGVGQIQVNARIGLTFANGLRSILRQDPDIIMVGEIRDMETAEMAIQASLTGHLVLSTLHTNDASSAVIRLVDMGIQPFLVSSTLSAVIAQRLIRVLCGNCKEAYVPADMALFGDKRPERLWRAVGCHACLNTGYSGQTGIFEMLLIDEGMRPALLNSPDAANIRRCASAKGMKSLWDDGLEKAVLGITSIEEIVRVTPKG